MPPSGHKPQSKDSLFAHTHGFPKEQTANRSTKPPRRSNRLPLAAFSACPSPTTFASAAPCCEPLPAPRTASSPSTDPATTSAVHPPSRRHEQNFAPRTHFASSATAYFLLP